MAAFDIAGPAFDQDKAHGYTMGGTESLCALVTLIEQAPTPIGYFLLCTAR